jgi:hypothetical protein
MLFVVLITDPASSGAAAAAAAAAVLLLELSIAHKLTAPPLSRLLPPLLPHYYFTTQLLQLLLLLSMSSPLSQADEGTQLGLGCELRRAKYPTYVPLALREAAQTAKCTLQGARGGGLQWRALLGEPGAVVLHAAAQSRLQGYASPSLAGELLLHI